jgi:hypothetical protein
MQFYRLRAKAETQVAELETPHGLPKKLMLSSEAAGRRPFSVNVGTLKRHAGIGSERWQIPGTPRPQGRGFFPDIAAGCGSLSQSVR